MVSMSNSDKTVEGLGHILYSWQEIGDYWKAEYSKPDGHYHLASDRTQRRFGIFFCVVDQGGVVIRHWLEQLGAEEVKWGPDAYYDYHNKRDIAQGEADMYGRGLEVAHEWQDAYDKEHNATEQNFV